MSDLLSKLKSFDLSKEVSVPGLGTLTIRPLNDVGFVVWNQLREELFNQSKKDFLLIEGNAKPFNGDEFTDSMRSLWGSNRPEPETKADYFAENSAFRESVISICHLMVYDGDKRLAETDQDARILRDVLTNHVGVVNTLIDVVVSQIEAKTEAFKNYKSGEDTKKKP